MSVSLEGQSASPLMTNTAPEPDPHARTQKDALIRGREGYDAQAAALVPEGDGAKGAPDNGPPEIKYGEYVLSRDPAWATEAKVTEMKAAFEERLAPWGLGCDGTAVRLAAEVIGVKRPVMAVKWDPKWGAVPFLPAPGALSTAPVEAVVSQTAVQCLAGWGDVPAADQTLIKALLAGPTNAVSRTFRMHLRGRFGAIGKTAKADQVKALSGLINSSATLPGVVDEEVQTKPLTYVLGTASVTKGYAFPGKKADADITPVTFSDGTKIEVASPHAPMKAGYHQHSVAEAADAASYLPAESRKVLKTIVLSPEVNPDDAYWAVEYKTPDFHSYMTGGADGVVTVYPSKKGPQPGDNYRRGTVMHETGHVWSAKTWGDDRAKGGWVRWKAAMDSDRVAVSGYAQNSIDEDVAETIQIYSSTKGTPKYDEYKTLVPARLALLEKELK
jgi:hypothetical protein